MTTKDDNIEGIFFDFDGTLLNTSEDFVVVLHQMQEEDNIPLIEPEKVRTHVSDGSRKLVQLAYELPENAPTGKLRQRFLEKYGQLIQNQNRSTAANLYNGIENLLLAIEHRNIPWGIVTNKPETYALPLLQQCRLNERCHVLIGSEQVCNAKPDPEPLLLACKKTGTHPKRSIYVGDHLRDIEAGNSVGMFTITALYGYIPKTETPEQWPANLTVQNAHDILRWLQQQQWRIPRGTDDV